MSGSKVALRSRVQWIRFVIEGKTSSNIYGCIAIFVWNVKRFLESFFGIVSFGIDVSQKRSLSIGREKRLSTKKKTSCSAQEVFCWEQPRGDRFSSYSSLKTFMASGQSNFPEEYPRPGKDGQKRT
jgi:hypothetical protein